MMARRAPESRSSTPALALLNQRGVEYRLLEFEHDSTVDHFGLEAARLLDVDPSQVFKTLIFQVDDDYCVGMISTACSVAPKRLAAAVGGRKARLAEASDAERLSGSVPGAISPFGLRQRLRTVLDNGALDHEQVYVSAGRRGLEVCVSTPDLITLTDAVVAPIGSSTGTR